MRKSTSPFIILTLIMLLLVLVAGFVFVFQAGLGLRDQLRSTLAETSTLHQLQAETEFELGSTAATRQAAVDALATAEAGSLLLEGQLVDSQQELDALTDQLEDATGELDSLHEAQATAEAQAPTVEILVPDDEAVVDVGDEVEIIVVASDTVGLATITVSIGDEKESSFSLDGQTLATRTVSWKAPEDEGDHTITAKAESINGVVADPVTVTLTVTDFEARNNALRSDIEAAVVDLRGLEPLEPIVPTLLTREELGERIEADFAEETSPEESHEDTLALSAFDFMDPDYDLYQAQIDLRSEGVLGFYDPETAEFVVVTNNGTLDPGEQWTHAHEFVHALQDQHYALETIADDTVDSEARAAIRALAEGEAELVQLLLLLDSDYFTQEEVDMIINDSEETDTSYLDELPPVIVSNLLFPYSEGFDFVSTLYRDGGFEALDEAWRNPPQSTEQIIHPDRYLAGDRPQIVALAPLTDTLGAGWRQVDEDILGEFFLREYLDQNVSITAARRASTGWGGDQYAVYWNESSDETVMALSLVWDTPMDGDEFAEVYQLYVPQVLDVEPTEQPDGSQCWVGDEVLCLYHTGRHSFVTRAPDLSTAAAVMNVIRESS